MSKAQSQNYQGQNPHMSKTHQGHNPTVHVKCTIQHIQTS